MEDYVDRYTSGEGLDIVYDTIGGAALDASFRAARLYGGQVVSCLGWGMHSLALYSFRATTDSNVFTLLPLSSGKRRAAHGAILREATRLVEAGKIELRLDPATYALADVNAAHRALIGGKADGKLVVSVS